MRQWWLDLLCLFKRHEPKYIEFGKARVPFSCKRCGRMWYEW